MQHTDTSTGSDPAQFPIDPSKIPDLVRRKDLRWLRETGVDRIVSALESDAVNGIPDDKDYLTRQRTSLGSNMYYREDKPGKALFQFVLEALKDPMICILLVYVMLSIGFGIKKHGLIEELYGGAIKVAAIILVVFVGAGSNYWAYAQCQTLSEAVSDIPRVDVVRGGRWQQKPISKIVVGDVVFLKPGAHVPADGLLLRGTALNVSDGYATMPVTAVGKDRNDRDENPFLLSGTRVEDGYGIMLVTAVGKDRNDQQIHLDGALINRFKNLTSVIGKFGHACAFLILLLVSARFFAGKVRNEKGKRVSIGGDDTTTVLDVLLALVGLLATTALTAVTSTPEGLLQAVKISLAHSMKRMMGDSVLVRKPSISHEIGSVTTICANMTGTLTEDTMEVTKFWLGLSSIEELNPNFIPKDALELLYQGIGLNTCQPLSRGEFEDPLNATENAISKWASQQMAMDITELKQNCTIVEIEPFHPKRKHSGVLIKKNANQTLHVHRKGAPEEIMAMCSQYYETTGIVRAIGDNERGLLESIHQDMTVNGYRCIAFAHRKASTQDLIFTSDQPLILLGLVGLKSSRRPGVREAIEDFRCAGVDFKIITGENKSTAVAIATELGLIDASNQSKQVITGNEFQNYNPSERLEALNNFRVMARATPSNRHYMVQCLKKKGHVVAVMGSGIEDVHALKEADIGLCFGIQGADDAKACSDIIIKEKKFSSVVNTLRWGRGFYDSVHIYTQFLLTASFVALVTDSVIAISPSEYPGSDIVAVVLAGKVPYAAFQLIWVKLIVCTFAALALVIRHPSQYLMQLKPRVLNEQPMVNNSMWANIIVQSLYQISVLLTIHFKGESQWNLNTKVRQTMIPITYVLCQVFNMLNVRTFENNFLEVIKKNKLFWAIAATTLVVQMLIVEVLQSFSDIVRLTWWQWVTCTMISAASWPISLLIHYFSKPKSKVE